MASAQRAVSGTEDRQRYRFAGGMEGVPEIARAPASDAPRLRAAGQAALDAAARVLPGAALAGLLAFAAVAASEWIGVALRKLRGLGLRPLAVGFAAALATGAVATALIKWIA